MDILIGTSGFSYEDWRGFFYPEDLPKREMLAYYAEHFPTVEVNATYYRHPGPGDVCADGAEGPVWVPVRREGEQGDDPRGGVPAGAVCGVPRGDGASRGAGHAGLRAGAFPWSFKATPPNRHVLEQFRAALLELPMVVEFRNSGWVSEETFALLRDLEMGFCCVDEPRLKGLMPPVVRATSPIGYVRFHGRNAAKWWQHEQAYERYDYLYTEDELAEWVPKIRELSEETERTYLFFNNHYEGKAGQNAQMLARLLNLTLPLAPTPTT